MAARQRRPLAEVRGRNRQLTLPEMLLLGAKGAGGQGVAAKPRSTTAPKEGCGDESSVSTKKRGRLEDVAEYETDIMTRLRRDEAERWCIDYLHPQTGVQARCSAKPMAERHRYILVDWIVEVHRKFVLQDSTLFLGVEIMDRFFQVRPTPKPRWQLIAVTSLFLACKHEEVSPPTVSDFSHITADVHSTAEILRSELEILSVLGFNLTVPTLFHFVRDRYPTFFRLELGGSLNPTGFQKDIRGSLLLLSCTEASWLYYTSP
eukprot:NODE_1338_length_1463_cov_15.415134_g1110_i0.p1 GENE.NODE_1338_length_1463_cov_15.415134_g1110_i0~~NODE_1338_length_1463_cov_15.415134_g1110_i0.p1  ORF type:complete len:262 (-),score=16.52 NODE_1338_length_1463_cov_15.415134_g1110_i0:606-1391(-)